MNSSYQYVFLKLLWVNPLLSVHNVAINLHHTDQLGTLSTEIPTSMHTYIAKSLKRERKWSHEIECAVLMILVEGAFTNWPAY